LKKDAIKSMMHPIRIKIIQELSLKGEATTKDILSACSDCSQATLYRHIKALLKNGIIEVAHENQVHGIIEKVYKLKSDAPETILGDPKDLTREDYLDLFSQFMISLLSDFSTYMQDKDALKNVENHIGFSSSSLLLTDEEFQEMFREIAYIVMKYMKNQPKEGRKMRKLSQIVTTSIPDKKDKGD